MLKRHNLAAAIALLILVASAPFTSLIAQSSSKTLGTNSFVDIANEVLPAVVNITIEPKGGGMSQEQMDEELLRFFMDRQGDFNDPFYGRGVSGSGVLIDKKDDLGYILTNNHVVEPLNEERNVLKLTFHQKEEDSTSYDKTTVIMGEGVRIIGRDPLSDLAVIEFLIPDDLAEVEPAEFGDSHAVEIGEFVLALGNPLNLNHTITQGIISGKSRYLRGVSIERLLQSDAVIQPGNSGGPLLNLDGEIIGINNAIMSRTGMWQGTSFAIPSNDAARISSQLIEMGRVVRGYLGISMEDVRRFREISRRYDLSVPAGVLVTFVVPNSPADVAGVHRLDVVTHIDGVRLNSPDHLLRLITAKPVDSEVDLEVVRLDDEKEPRELGLAAKLSERPNEDLIRNLHSQNDSSTIPSIPENIDESEIYFGMTLESTFIQDTQTAGLLVEEVEKSSPAAEAGIGEGDLITHFNGRAVASREDFRNARARARDQEGDKAVELIIQRDNGAVESIKIQPEQ